MELTDNTIHKTLYYPQILPDSNTQKLLFSLTITSRFLTIYKNQEYLLLFLILMLSRRHREAQNFFQPLDVSRFKKIEKLLSVSYPKFICSSTPPLLNSPTLFLNDYNTTTISSAGQSAFLPRPEMCLPLNFFSSQPSQW